MGLYDGQADRKTQTGALSLHFFPLSCLVKLFKYLFPVRGWNSGTSVISAKPPSYSLSAIDENTNAGRFSGRPRMASTLTWISEDFGENFTAFVKTWKQPRKHGRLLSIRETAKRIAYIPQAHAPTFNYSMFETVLMGTNTQIETLRNPGADERTDRAAIFLV